MSKRKRANVRSGKSKRRRSSKKGVTKAVKKYVKRTIHTMAENKLISASQINQPIPFCLDGFVVPYQIGFLPVLSRGFTNAQRIGNQIRVRKSFLTGFINGRYAEEQTSTGWVPHIYVRYAIVRYKPAVKPSLAVADFADFFTEGALTHGFRADIRDIMYKINTEKFQVYLDRTVYIGVHGTSASSSKDQFSRSFMASATKHLKGTIQYTDNENASPTNRQLHFLAWAASPDGRQDSGRQSAAEIHWRQMFVFEDM